MSLRKQVYGEENEQTNQSGNSLSQSIASEEINELKKQNKLLRDRMIEIEQSQESRNQKIDELIEKLEDGATNWNSEVNRAVEKVSNDLKESQRAAYLRIEKRFEAQSSFAQKFHKVQVITQFALYVIAILLFIALIARTLVLGLWEGLFLSNLWNLEEWYWKVLTVVIIASVVIGIGYLILKGIQDLRY